MKNNITTTKSNIRISCVDINTNIKLTFRKH